MEELLTDCQIEHFIPWRKVDCIRSGKRIVREEPAVRNLVFARASRSKLLSLKADAAVNALLQFKTRPIAHGSAQTVPIVVPDKMMDDFIRVYRVASPHNLTYLTADDMTLLRENARVAIVGGPFDGCEGWFQRIKGSRTKQFVVQLEWFMGCASQLVDCEIVKIISNHGLHG